MSDIVDVKRGIRVVKSQLSKEGEYSVFQNALAPMGYYDKFNRNGEETYIISAGAAGEVGYCVDKFWAADDCFVFDDCQGIINKYVYYYLRNMKDYLKRNVRKASIPRLPKEVIEKIVIKLPPLERQQEIINILDRFDVICNDLTIGLPAEKKLRQKQYEYYRDKLLTFKEMERIV